MTCVPAKAILQYDSIMWIGWVRRRMQIGMPNERLNHF